MAQTQHRIYLDHAATTPVDVRVLEAMQPYWAEHFGNTSSIHSIGREAHQGLDQARQTVAEVLGCSPQEIVFTGCGTANARNSDPPADVYLARPPRQVDLGKMRVPHIINQLGGDIVVITGPGDRVLTDVIATGAGNSMEAARVEVGRHITVTNDPTDIEVSPVVDEIGKGPDLPVHVLFQGADSGHTTATVNPGVVWCGKYMELGLAAQIPLNDRTGHNVGVFGLVHVFLDDLFPNSIGRPLFDVKGL